MDTEAYDKTNDDNNGDDENENLGCFSDIAEHCLRLGYSEQRFCYLLLLFCFGVLFSE